MEKEHVKGMCLNFLGQLRKKMEKAFVIELTTKEIKEKETQKIFSYDVGTIIYFHSLTLLNFHFHSLPLNLKKIET